MNVVDFGEFSKNRSEKHEINWLREVKRELQKNSREGCYFKKIDYM